MDSLECVPKSVKLTPRSCKYFFSASFNSNPPWSAPSATVAGLADRDRLAVRLRFALLDETAASDAMPCSIWSRQFR